MSSTRGRSVDCVRGFSVSDESMSRSGSRRDAGKGSDETDGAVETAECCSVAFGGRPSQSFYFLSLFRPSVSMFLPTCVNTA